jgi:serine/threonine protein phosphatase PrpC
MAETATAKPSQPFRGLGAARPSVRFAMRSHPGRVRGENQDTCAAVPELGIYVVCDGMGGAAAGEIASKIAAEAFVEAIGRSQSDPGTASSSLSIADSQRVRLSQAVAAANDVVYQRAQKYRALRGMGTTLVAALVGSAENGGVAWMAHVGDSRCYLLRGDRLRQLTTDHSVVEEQIQAGILTRQQAEFSPVRNVITRAIGTQPQVPPDILDQPLEPGDTLLLASDGLTREIADGEIARILQSSASLDVACDDLIRAANAQGGQDNITVLLIAKD